MIELEILDHWARIRLNRPPVNAINDEWLARFHAALDELDARDDVHVLVVTSELKSFCAGMDLARVKELFALQQGANVMVDDVHAFQHLFARIEAARFVSIAEIGGVAFGGGLELALACDLRVAATTARLGLPEANLGLIPGAGGTQRLTRLCGRGTAARIILTGEAVDGLTAERLGIVQYAYAPDLLSSGVAAIVASIARLSPFSLREVKQLIAAAADPERDGYREEREADRRLFDQPDTRARIGAFIDGKR